MSTISPPRALLGVQQPRVLRRPADAVRDGHRELLKLSDDVGLHLDEGQQTVIGLWTCERRDGSPAATECATRKPRQNGKGVELEVMGLDSLFLSKLPLTIWTAHLFKTALESFMRLRARLQLDPVLDDMVENYYQSNQRLAIVLKSGPRIEFMARNDAGGRGASAGRVILDEDMFLTDPMMGALFPTMAAQSMNVQLPQLIYAGSASMAVSAVSHRTQRRALSGVDAEGLAYAEWSVDPDSFDPSSPADWALANPALGIRISEDYIRKERQALSPEVFQRERLGVPDPEPSDVGELAISQEAWRSSFDGRSSVPGDVTFGLDMGYETGGKASIAFAGRRGDGLLHVEVIHRDDPGDWIIDQAVRCTADGSPLLVDPSGAVSAFMPDLVAAGVPLVPMTRRDVAAACVRFSVMVGNGQVRHLGSGDLNAAVATAVCSPRSDAFVWKRRVASAPDLSPLYAVTLAAWPQEAELEMPAIY